MVTAKETEIILPGPATVADWKSNRPMYMAHRGGSADWPEHSLRAYTQAVYEGYGCLEVSLARTSDGVLIANHDPSINAVVYGGVTGLPDVSAMTWAEVSAYQIKGPVKHLERGPAPFVRLIDLLDVYSESHIFMVDPKSIASTHYASILDLLDSYGGNQRFIGKWVGSNLPWSNALIARGYESWGAFYSADWTPGAGFPTAWSDQWTMLGLTFTADQAHWDEIIATGKPVLAHICETEADVVTGLSKGAVGFQVSSPENINPLPAVDPEALEIGYADLPAGSTLTVNHNGTSWPDRPTGRTDIVVNWVGPDTVPPGAISTDMRFVVAA